MQTSRHELSEPLVVIYWQVLSQQPGHYTRRKHAKFKERRGHPCLDSRVTAALQTKPGGVVTDSRHLYTSMALYLKPNCFP